MFMSWVLINDGSAREMLIYCHPGKNQSVRAKAWFFPLLQIKHLRARFGRPSMASAGNADTSALP